MFSRSFCSRLLGCRLLASSVSRLCCPTGSRTISSTDSLPWSELSPYRSVEIDLATAWSHGWRPPHNVDFSSLLRNHLQQWKGEGRSGVWLHLPLPLLHLANDAVGEGFTLHHSSNEARSLVLCAWLEEGSPSRLPHYASHQVGVSGIVWREETGQMLVIQDKYKLVNWKFPGGLAEPSEDIGKPYCYALSAGCLATAADAAVREVREETGVETEFRSILAFRQHHHMPHTFGCSDLYFVCRLHPLTFDLKPCEKEVVRCAWMSVQELAASEESTVLTRRIARLLLNNRHDNFQRIDISMEEWPSLYKGHNYKLFLRTQR